MNVQPLPEPGFARDSWQQNVSCLVESVGTPRFEQHLFRAVQESFRCEHLSAFAVSATARPRVLFAANRGAAPVARTAANAYVDRHWNADPVNNVIRHERDLTRGLLIHMTGEEMIRLRYRRACYSMEDWRRDGVNLAHKLCLVRQRGEDVIKVNFYRHRDAGAFDADDLRRIVESSDVLLAFLVKHAPAASCASTHSQRLQFQACIQQISPHMPHREVEVCAAIAAGMGSKAIGQTLNIGLNTVLTYRKRAYARLGICSQNELVRLIYSAGPSLQ